MTQVFFTRLRPAALGVAGILLIAALPSLIGALILAEMVRGTAGGLSEPADVLRRAAYPGAIWLHILGGAGFVLLGMMQFSTRLRQKVPMLHRWSGRVLVAGGLGLAFASFWMNFRYPNTNDSGLHDALQTMASVALLGCLGFGIRAIKAGKIRPHRAWMTRAYALCLGAGTQTLFLLPLFAIGHPPPVLIQDIVYGGAWVVNLAVAEWWIRRR